MALFSPGTLKAEMLCTYGTLNAFQRHCYQYLTPMGFLLKDVYTP